MKRTLIALGITALLITLCLVSHRSLQKKADGLDRALTRLETLYTEDISACLREAETLRDDFETESRWLPYFLPHETIHQIEESLALFPVLLREEGGSRFCSEVVRCRLLIKDMYATELPLGKNVF